LEEPDVFPVLTNGGFEVSREGGTAYGWRKVGGEAYVSREVRHRGEQSLRLSSATESTKWAYQVVEVDPGKWYSLGAWARGRGAEAFLRLSWYESADGSGRAIEYVDSAGSVADPGAFRPLSTGPAQAPAGARTAKVRLMMRPSSAVGAAVYFDSISFAASMPGLAADDTAADGSGRARSPRLVSGARNNVLPVVRPGDVPVGSGTVANAGGEEAPEGSVDPVTPSGGGSRGTDIGLALLILGPLGLIALLFLRDLTRSPDRG
jgi:hypothetical protein